ncbi:MAG TPA: hypothetical protein VF700_04995 [Segetibacter sp.]
MPSIQNKIFKVPDDPNIKIWRYMDFTKFVSMLENNGLFFSRADCLGDPFEGSIPRANEREQSEIAKAWPADAFEKLESWKAWRRQERQNMFINCWHMNEDESAAMWKLYTKSEEAICIQSTFTRLHECVDEKVFIGEVRYIDYERDLIYVTNAFYPFIHKRKFFAHEREVRAVIWQIPDYGELPIEGGIWKQVELSELIENVYVAPTSPAWFRDLVEKMVERYSLNRPVRQSSLDEEPCY